MMLIAIIFIVLTLFLGHLGHHWSRNRNSLVTNWPVLGMLPGLFCNLDRIFDFFTHDILDLCGGTFKFKGPWFPSLDFVLTSNPMNVNYILSKNFLNYEKGSEFREIFKPFGDGIVTSDSDSWKSQRKSLHSIMLKNNKFVNYQDIVFRQVLEKGLIPVLEHIVQQGTEMDLEDVLQRFDYDNICLLALGFDSKALSVSFPEVPSKAAFNDIEDSLMCRYLMPVIIWKLQRWLQIGEEKRLSKAMKIADHFLYDCISSKREKLRSRNRVEEDEFDLLTALLVEQEGEILTVSGKISDKFLRDTAFNFMAAGKDTISACLSWFFWLIATNPSVETKILQEIKANSPTSKDRNMILFFTGEELNQFTYLHAALCETLRLYPPVPINHKNSIQPDVLPSGEHVDGNTRILVSFYSMGRNEEIWGKDCLEFKPERWISENGDILHVPTYKFSAFSAGPRTCLGKDMSFKQMKLVTINVLWNYQVELVEGQPIAPSKSITLHIENGLKVRIKKRDI
ncbi:alkane hydroxylase MAH1-like [Durio zibethinus]|uniref:Alkane hydroxylase MAH1-like n=1 Tax=Durio zibethinus TaxID=66656 RepID=A0A6P5YNP7_DURZI|nr:alkane hydroxylase MAH1-like [Durio zibethinus]